MPDRLERWAVRGGLAGAALLCSGLVARETGWRELGEALMAGGCALIAPALLVIAWLAWRGRHG